MIKNILHIGGHVDGEWLDVKMEWTPAGYKLPPNYERSDREMPKISVRDYSEAQEPMMIEAKTNTTFYVRESIMTDNGRKEYFVYVASDVGPGWIRNLINGYKYCDSCPKVRP